MIMMPEEKIFENVLKKLSGAPKERPWKTATTLARGLDGVSSEGVEKMLIEHYSSEKKPKVRYSSLPSRRTLEVLWGDIEHVGWRALESLTKDDSALELDLRNGGGHDKPEVFLSHSHRDFKPVKALAEKLISVNISVWLAESNILKSEPIHERIIQGLESCRTLLLYLSDHSIQSRWTGKEVGRAMRRAKKVVVVLDEDSHVVQELLGCKRLSQLEFVLREEPQTREYFGELINYKGVRFFWGREGMDSIKLGNICVNEANSLLGAFSSPHS